MGKLHTLRREIERNPDQWYCDNSGWTYFHGAWFDSSQGRWKPSNWGRSYRRFIRKVLIDMERVGPTDSGTGGGPMTKGL